MNDLSAPSDLFSRSHANPILSAADWPYPAAHGVQSGGDAPQGRHDVAPVSQILGETRLSTERAREWTASNVRRASTHPQA